MNDLLLARSITHAQQMGKVLERFRIHYSLKRATAAITKHGCGYVLSVHREDTQKALAYLEKNGVLPKRVIEGGTSGKDGASL